MEQKKHTDPKGAPKKKRFNWYWIYGLIAIGLLAMNFMNFNGSTEDITYSKFDKELLESGDVKEIIVYNKQYGEVTLTEEALKKDKYTAVRTKPFGGVNKGPHYEFEIGDIERFQNRLAEAQGNLEAQNLETENKVPVFTYNFDTKKDIWTPLLSWLIPIGLIILLWIFLMRRVSAASGGPGGQIFNIGKSKANLYDKDTKVNVTFNDVAGLDEAKEEVMEVVDFLKNPKKYTNLGGKIPKGVLLVGPPGTGKTLLAKAMAGEAQVPFFTISGSDFVEMFVGVGASRVRDLFKQAREKAPCIVFIDEIDAIGRARGRNIMQGNDERESTLNQLLVEMDGFSGDQGVILLAATNRPDVLDSALLRPGRFDRQISIDKPDLNGREQIFKVHLKPIKVSKDVDPAKLAAQTPGFAGAEIANICNEAALVAARRNKKSVEMIDFNDAIDRVIGGLEKKNKIISPQEKKIVAYHEAGHAITGWFLEYADPLVKVSIVPRGIAALGYAQYLPKEQYLYTKEQLMDTMCMALGGRVAEDIIFGKISTGAQNDLERITKMAYAMVTIYGMNEKVGNISYYDPSGQNQFTKPYSDETATLIDEEVRKLIDDAYDRTKALLKEKHEQLETIAQELLAKEIIFKEDLTRLLGERPFDHPPVEAKKVESSNGNGSEIADKADNTEEESPATEEETTDK